MRSDIALPPRTVGEIVGRVGKWLKFTIANAAVAAAPVGFKDFDLKLSETAANTAQTLTLFTLPANHIVVGVCTKLRETFEDVSDSAFNSTTLVVGVAGTTNMFLTSTQLNVNGTEVIFKLEDILAANTGIQSATAGTAVIATVASMSAKSLSDLDKGIVDIFVCVANLDQLDQLYENDYNK